MSKLTRRQEEILKIIVEEHTRIAAPVGSKHIIGKYMKDISSATVRNDMAHLEATGMIQKTHTSSGRIPTLAAYRHYRENILSHDSQIGQDIKRKLRTVFASRYASIDDVISRSLAVISETMRLPSVVLENTENDVLKRIDLIPVGSRSATIIFVTSSGHVNNNLITLDRESRISDLAICVRIFNDRLIDTPMGDILEKARELEPIIKRQVKEYEYVIQEVVSRIFKRKENPDKKVFGVGNVVTHPEFNDRGRLKQLLDLLEDSSVWQQFALMHEKTGKTMIAFGKDIGLPKELAFATTSIDVGSHNRQLTVVGPTRMDYSKVQSLLDFIKTEIERGWNKGDAS